VIAQTASLEIMTAVPKPREDNYAASAIYYSLYVLFLFLLTGPEIGTPVIHPRSEQVQKT
jgi:hypothetical protein